MRVQRLSLPENSSIQRKRPFRIAVDIGQYHFIDWRGWREEWRPLGAREWWKRYLWLKDGGWSQDEM